MGITKLNNVFSALAVFAITALLSVQAEYYWLAVGIPAGANGNVDNGLGNYLVLTNDDPSVSFNAVNLYDVRRRANNGTELYKNNGQNSTPPYEGCLKGGAHYDLRLPIRDEAGTEFTFVGFANEAFRGNDFLGSIHLPNTLEYINKQAFWQARYLKEFVWPEDMTRLNTIGSRILDTCSSLVGPIEWPSKFPNVAQACWNCPALVGFGGICITNLGDNAFQNCSSLRTVEFGGAEPVTFGNCTFQNTGSLKTVLFHDNPPTLNKYILGFDPSTGGAVSAILPSTGGPAMAPPSTFPLTRRRTARLRNGWRSRRPMSPPRKAMRSYSRPATRKLGNGASALLFSSNTTRL